MIHLKPPPPLLHLRLLLLLLSAIAVATTSTAQFKEAPKFYNSPDCPTTVDHPTDTLTTSTTTAAAASAAVHVAMTLDATYLRGSMAAILSTLQHSSCPQNIFFHFITSTTTTLRAKSSGVATAPPHVKVDPSLLRATISASFPYLNFQIYPFNTSAVAGLISTSIRSALDCPLNYARTYLADILPLHVTKVIYLDSDLVLVDDIATLAATHLPSAAVLAAPEYCNANFTFYFTPTFWSNPSLSSTFANRNSKPCYFNTGVMVIDLNRWRTGNYTRKIEEWMELQKRMRIYELGSLPPFLLVFAGDIAPVDHKWNQHGLGGDNFRGLCRDLHPGPVSLLHWSGKGKPWVRLDAERPCPLDALWAPYDLLKPPFSFDS